MLFRSQVKAMFATQTYIESDQYRAYQMAISALSAEQSCDNCKEYGSYKCTKCDGEMYYKTEPSDLISRKYIINRISEEYHTWGDDYDALQILGDIEDAPSVSAERVGVWKHKTISTYSKEYGMYEETYLECSECGYIGNLNEPTNFCSSCGARMENTK